MDAADFTAEAVEVKALCRRYRVPLIINDNVDVALQSGADGVHVGIEDTPVAQLRQMVPKDFIIGATAKTVEQARAAERAGADYLGVGAVFPSPTKKNAIRITREQLKEICGSVSIPAVAIGGISMENAAALQGGGMAGIAVVSAIFAAPDIRQAAADLRAVAETSGTSQGNAWGRPSRPSVRSRPPGTIRSTTVWHCPFPALWRGSMT